MFLEVFTQILPHLKKGTCPSTCCSMWSSIFRLYCSWMSQEVSKWFVNGLFHLLINGIFLGVITHWSEPFTNFQPDIQVGAIFVGPGSRQSVLRLYGNRNRLLLGRRLCWNSHTFLDHACVTGLGSHRIHVWYIYLHLVDFYGKCRQIYHTWILWVLACFEKLL